jgi:hypothetical protein
VARTGQFGRSPRVAASLTNTLVAIAREFQRQRDQNLMDAWQKGGQFEGQKATDALVLAHWKERMAGVSKDDPLYDTYKNAHTQLDYSIHESKMTASYALGNKSDGEMVKFYLGWAKKVPKNSEFYRVLQRDAGQYMRAQAATSEAEKRQAAEDRYQRMQNGTRDRKEAGGEYLIETLRRVAQSGYADGAIGPLIEGPGSGSDLTAFDPTDPEQMLRLLDVITVGTGTKGRGGSVGNPDTIYHDDDKNPVTGEDILKRIAKFDPKFTPGQPFDVAYVTGMLDRQIDGLNERIERARKTGHETDAVSLEKSKSYVAELNREVAAWPIQKSYTDLRETFDRVAQDPSSSPAAVMKAWQSYSGSLQRLADDPRIADNDALRSRIVAEALLQTGTPTLNESFTGMDGGFSGNAEDTGVLKFNIERAQEQVEAVAKGQAVWTYGKTEGGVFVPQAGGNEVGASDPQTIAAGGTNAQTITVADPRGGSPMQMVVTAVPVMATAKDPVTGEALPSTSTNPVAYAYNVQKGGVSQVIYGFQTTGDGFVFSSDPPWDKDKLGVPGMNGNKPITVDMTPIVAERYAAAGNGDVAAGKALVLAANADLGSGWTVQGAGTSGPKGQAVAKPGDLVFDPSALLLTDTRTGTGGSADPNTDFHSLTLATLMGDPEGLTILNNLDKNPAFRSQLDDDAHLYSGSTWDPASGTWVPGTGDQAKLGSALGQNGRAAAATSLMSFAAEGISAWQRITTGSPFMGTKDDGRPLVGPDGDINFGKLATDLVKGTPFEAIGAIFQPGTNVIKPPADDSAEAALRFAHTQPIKLPTIDVKVDPKPIVGTVAGGTSGQTGSQPPGGTNSQTGSQAPNQTQQNNINRMTGQQMY